MKTRYDFMKDGSVKDIEDGNFYPDVLTLNYNVFKASSALTPLEISDIDIDKFWWSTQKQYGVAEYDDIILSLNGVAHRNFLAEGMIVFFPKVSDIATSFGEVNL